METMRKNMMAGVCIVAAVLAGGACRRSTTYTSKDGSVTVEKKGNGDAASMTFTGKNGEKVSLDMSGGKVPDDYPKDMPVYEGTKVVMSQTSSEKHTASLVLESMDPAEKIADFYKKGLESNGWKIEGTMNMGQMNMFTASKEKRQAVVQIVNNADKRQISQVLSDKQ
jgi:hypothetical protein